MNENKFPSWFLPTSDDLYATFLAKKRKMHTASGFEANTLTAALYPFQRHIVQWALRLGRAAIFADCGLGKTLMQLEWARNVHQHTGKPVLILAPLAVSGQAAEARPLDLDRHRRLARAYPGHGGRGGRVRCVVRRPLR